MKMKANVQIDHTRVALKSPHHGLLPPYPRDREKPNPRASACM
jgi:hypothetical protein